MPIGLLDLPIELLQDIAKTVSESSNFPILATYKTAEALRSTCRRLYRAIERPAHPKHDNDHVLVLQDLLPLLRCGLVKGPDSMGWLHVSRMRLSKGPGSSDEDVVNALELRNIGRRTKTPFGDFMRREKFVAVPITFSCPAYYAFLGADAVTARFLADRAKGVDKLAGTIHMLRNVCRMTKFKARFILSILEADLKKHYELPEAESSICGMSTISLEPTKNIWLNWTGNHAQLETWQAKSRARRMPASAAKEPLKQARTQAGETNVKSQDNTKTPAPRVPARIERKMMDRQRRMELDSIPFGDLSLTDRAMKASAERKKWERLSPRARQHKNADFLMKEEWDESSRMA